MAWISITMEEVSGRLAKAELSALTSIARAGGHTADSIMGQAIADSVRQVRGYIAACSRNLLGDGQSIPDELAGATLALVRRYLFTRLPGMRELYDELRQAETADALALLRDVAACRFLVVQPQQAAAEQAGGPGVQIVRKRPMQASRSQTSGLM